MFRRLPHEEMILFVDNILHPKGRGFTSEEINEQLLLFCANCPNPAAAMDIVLETEEALSASELVERALACAPQKVADLPESELASTHPLRSLEQEKEDVDRRRDVATS